MPHLTSTAMPLKIQFNWGDDAVVVRDFEDTADDVVGELVEITRGVGPQPGTARIEFPKLRFDTDYLDATIGNSQLVTIWANSETDANVIFHGHAMTNYQSYDQEDHVGVLCHDITELFQRDVCFGIIYRADAGSASISTLGAELIFNRGGEPNRNLVPYDNQSKWGFIGSGIPSETTHYPRGILYATYWNPIDAIIHILDTQTADFASGLYEYNVIETDLDPEHQWRQGNPLSATPTRNHEFPEWNVNGLTIAEAIDLILRDYGYSYVLRTGAELEEDDIGDYGDSKYEINWIFFPRQTSEMRTTQAFEVSLKRPVAAAKLRDLTWTDAMANRGDREASNIGRVTGIVAMGAKKTFESTILLSPGWDVNGSADIIASPSKAVPGRPEYGHSHDGTLSKYFVPRSAIAGIGAIFDNYAEFDDEQTYAGLDASTETFGTYEYGTSFWPEQRRTLSTLSQGPQIAGHSGRLVPARPFVEVFVDGAWQKIDRSITPLQDEWGVWVHPDCQSKIPNGATDPDYGTFWPNTLPVPSGVNINFSVFPLRATLRVESDTRLMLRTDWESAPGTVKSVTRFKDFGDDYGFERAIPTSFNTVFYGTQGQGSGGITAATLYRDDRILMTNSMIRILDQAMKLQQVYGFTLQPLKEFVDHASVGDFISTFYDSDDGVIWAINRHVVGLRMDFGTQTIHLDLARPPSPLL